MISINRKNPTAGEITSSLTGSNDAPGLHFDGAAGYVDIASPPDLGTKFSFEFIAQADDWGSADRLLIDFKSGSSRFQLGSTSSTSYNLGIFTTGGWANFGAKVLDDLKVHHVVVTVDGTSVIAYDNGNQVGTLTAASSGQIDAATDANIGRDIGSGASLFNGLLLRTRFWNKTLTAAEVTASYENASVPFADQYGSQTAKITGDSSTFASGLGTWSTGNNWNSQTNPSNNMVLSATATDQRCYGDFGITAGKRYRFTYDASAITGTVTLRGWGASGYITVGTFVAGTAQTIEFVATGFITGELYIAAAASGDAITLDNLLLVEIGAVADYDLAFANPTQSLMVQDRAGAADGTASATGVAQVTPIEQLNSKAARIGTSAATPADGELLVSGKVGVGVSPDSSLDVFTTSYNNIRIGEDKDNQSTQRGGILAQPYLTAEQATAGMLMYVDGTGATQDTAWIQLGGGHGSYNAVKQISFYTAADAVTTTGTERLTIDTAGNVGLAVTPEATNALATSLQVGGNANLSTTKAQAAGGEFDICHNTYWGADGNQKYISTDEASMIRQGGGALTFKNAPSGTADTTATFTTRFTISSAGATTLDGTVSVGGTANGLLYVKEDDGSNAIQLRADVSNLYNEIDSTKEFNIRTEAGALRFSTVNTERLRIDTAGQVNVSNAADPTLKLQNTTGGTGDTAALVFGLSSNTALDSARIDAKRTSAGTVDLQFYGGQSTTQTQAAAGVVITGGATGGIYEVGGVLKENLLTNSGFDVWSNSTLENVGSDLAVDGTFSDTANWTEEAGWAVTGGKAVATSAADNKQLYQARTYTVGKLYRIVFEISGYSAGGVYLSIATGAVSPVFAANGTHTFVFEAPDASAYINFRASGTTTLDLEYVTLFEVTPACLGGSLATVDGWTKGTTHGDLDHMRVHSDGGTNTHDGSFYSLYMNYNRGGQTLYGTCAWPLEDIGTSGVHLQKFAGRTVTFGCWMKSSTAGKARLSISENYSGWDDVAYSVVTTGTGWEWHEVTRTISASPTGVYFVLQVEGDGDYDCYFSQPMAVFGSAIGSGNYSRPSGEIVMFEKLVNSTGYFTTGFSDVSGTLNVEADSNGCVPKGANGLFLDLGGQDSGSAGTDTYFRCGASSTLGFVYANTYGLANDALLRNSTALCKCDSNGDIEARVEASGSGTFDAYLQYAGVQLR